jgi:hypothetical protein
MIGDRPVRLTLITRQRCHLCDVARQALARVAEATGEVIAEIPAFSRVAERRLLR